MTVTHSIPAPVDVKEPAKSARIDSVDVLRGATILVMMFVNDLAGVKGVPAWMEHVHPSNSDGMTFVDVVFPAFLFIVGISIPFAIGSRLDRGESTVSVWRHILLRVIGLLTVGFFMVNSETISETGPLSPPLWELVMYAGVALTWLSLPRELAAKRSHIILMRTVGVALLVAVALFYRGNDGTGIIQMRPQWWGILGLIGWAYLMACLVYVPLRRNLAGVVGCISLLYCLYVADAAGGLEWLRMAKNWVSVGEALGSQAAVTVAGVVLGIILLPESPVKTHSSRMRWVAWYALALLCAGNLLHAANGIHRMFIFNKNAATPPWCLVSSAITAVAWLGTQWLVDVRMLGRATKLLTLAGQNALLAYILAPAIYAFMRLTHIELIYGGVGNSFPTGFLRSIAWAFLLVWLIALLRRRNVQLKI